MSTKRFLAMMLAVLLCISCFSACGSSRDSAVPSADSSTVPTAEPEPPEESAVPTQAPAAAEADSAAAPEAVEEPAQLEAVTLPLFDEPPTITFWTALPFFMEGMVSDMGTDLYLLSQLQKDCNFELQVTSVNGMTENEQFNLMIATGDYCDIMSGIANYSSGYDAAISNDIIIDLYDLVPQYAPNYWYYVNSSKDIRANLITDDGALPTIATIYKETGCENRGLLYRSDWLQDLGLEVPSTYDQLHTYIQQCNETYGSKGLALAGSGMGSVAGVVTQLSYGFDFAIGGYNIIDGEVVYSYLNDNCYDYLALMHAWYTDGTIANEFYSFGTDEGDKGVPNGIYCMTISSAANLSTMEGYADEGAVYEIGAMGAPTDGSGNALHYRWTDDFSPLKRRDSWAISTACEDPEDVLAVVNYLFSEDGQLFFNYGTENYTFTYDASGKPQYTDLVLNNPDYGMFASYVYVSNVATEYLPGVMDATVGYYYFSDDEWTIFETFRDCEADGSYNMPTAVSLTEEENTEYATYASDIETFVSTELLRFITEPGALSEDAFATFRQTILDMGGEQMEALYQAAYERYLEKVA